MRATVYVNLLFLILGLSSCGNLKKQRKVIVRSGERPAWLFEAGKACQRFELCAVGEAPGRLGAEIAARNNLAKIFETKIKSTLNIQTTSKSETIDQVVTGKINEDVNEKIELETKEVLKGVQIKEFFETKDSFFALAALDKPRAAKGIASEIETVDTEMVALINDGRRSSLNKGLRLYKVREALNLRHQFLSDRRLSSPVSLSTILKKKKAKRDLGTIIKVDFKEVGRISQVKNIITRHLLDYDFKVVKSKAKSSQYQITGSLKEEEQHMKVSGFKRYKFFLHLKSLNANNEKIGAIDFETNQSGRNLNQAYENALPEIKDFLEKKIVELNID
ncbi:MAG: hypothetical protein ACJAT2_002458 [Bacteriovoracaceae bacterium]|jgi:hypothetical protein